MLTDGEPAMSRGLRAFDLAVDRVHKAGSNVELAQIAVAEASLWAGALIEANGDRGVAELVAIRYVRDRVMHGFAAPLHFKMTDSYSDTYTNTYGTLVWTGQLPESPDGKDRLDRRAAYDAAFGGKAAFDSLSRVRQLLSDDELSDQ